MRRRMSQIERLFWAMGDRQVTFAVTARVSGACPADRLPTAAAALARRHPMLAARIVRAGPFGGWITSEGTGEPPVRVVAAAADADAGGATDCADVVRDELLRPFDLGTGPLSRIVVVDRGGGFDLVVVCHHLAADGLSAVYALRDLLTHLGGSAPVDGTPIVAPPAESLVAAARREKAPAARQESAAGVARKPAGARPAGPAPSPGAGDFAVRTWSLDPGRTATLVERCRSEGTTVHAALCTAFLRAFADLDTGPGVRRVETPASLRHCVTLPAEDTVGLYIALVESALDLRADPGFWDAARSLRADLRGRLTAAAMHGRVRGLRWLGFLPTAVLRRLAVADRIRYDLSVTNLGAVTLPLEYGPLRVESLHGPALRVHAPNHRVLGVATVCGRLHLSMSSVDAVLMDGVSTRAMEHLARATA